MITSIVTGSVKATKEGDKKDRDGRGLRWAATGLFQSSPLCREKARLEGQERSKCKGPEEHPRTSKGAGVTGALGGSRGRKCGEEAGQGCPGVMFQVGVEASGRVLGRKETQSSLYSQSSLWCLLKNNAMEWRQGGQGGG